LTRCAPAAVAAAAAAAADFYADFARVADDESRHFSWCAQRLRELGHMYGDMPAHDLLWEGAQASSGNLTARCARALLQLGRTCQPCRCVSLVLPHFPILTRQPPQRPHRLAIVPMSQEARGLDAGPRLAARLVGAGDNVSAAIVARISLEERAHVAVGA
jgi:uncharacterized ferritin-like protein (DUF455 family)